MDKALRTFGNTLPLRTEQRSRASIPPERVLMAAVLHDAVDCYCRSRSPKVVRETEEWLMSEDRSSPFSFCNVCDALDLDPDAIRDALQRRNIEEMR